MVSFQQNFIKIGWVVTEFEKFYILPISQQVFAFPERKYISPADKVW